MASAFLEQNTIDGTYRSERKGLQHHHVQPGWILHCHDEDRGDALLRAQRQCARHGAGAGVERDDRHDGHRDLGAGEGAVDAWGNYYDDHYNEDNAYFTATGQRVSKIEYTHKFNASGGTLPGVVNSVNFTYDPAPSLGASATRQDVRWTRFGLTRIPRNRRLLSIDSPRGTYSLIYANSSSPDVSRLQTVRYCAGTA